MVCNRVKNPIKTVTKNLINPQNPKTVLKCCLPEDGQSIGHLVIYCLKNQKLSKLSTSYLTECISE